MLDLRKRNSKRERLKNLRAFSSFLFSAKHEYYPKQTESFLSNFTSLLVWSLEVMRLKGRPPVHEYFANCDNILRDQRLLRRCAERIGREAFGLLDHKDGTLFTISLNILSNIWAIRFSKSAATLFELDYGLKFNILKTKGLLRSSYSENIPLGIVRATLYSSNKNSS